MRRGSEPALKKPLRGQLTAGAANPKTEKANRPIWSIEEEMKGEEDENLQS